MNASKFEVTSKSSGASSIASFFAKKDTEDAGVEKQSNCEQMAEIKSPLDNRCPSLEPTDAAYVRDEIDQSIMNELPDDIRNEIQQFLGVSKAPERTKRTSKGIEKYTVCRNTTGGIKSTQTKDVSDDKIMPPQANNDTLGDAKPGDNISGSDGFICCSKCGQQIAESKLDEHNDFHFALEVQKRSEITLDNLQADEPPKKKRKGTISNFFVAKGR